MKIEDQVCSLELAKKLKDIGVKQDSLFYYGAFENPLYGIFKESDAKEDDWRLFYSLERNKCPPDYDVSAFTVAEILIFLPEFIEINDWSPLIHRCQLMIYKHDNDGQLTYSANYYNPKVDLIYDDFEENNLANTLSKLLIYLIENNLIAVEKIK